MNASFEPDREPVILRRRQLRASGRKGLPTTPTVYPEWTRDLDPISGLHLRRAVMRTLLRAEAPQSLGDILNSLRFVDGVYMTGFPDFDERHKLSDLLGHQVRARRVRRVGRGRYEAIPEAISRTNLWRITNWERFV